MAIPRTEDSTGHQQARDVFMASRWGRRGGGGGRGERINTKNCPEGVRGTFRNKTMDVFHQNMLHNCDEFVKKGHVAKTVLR